MAIAVFAKKAESNAKKIMKEKVVEIYDRFFQVSQNSVPVLLNTYISRYFYS